MRGKGGEGAGGGRRIRARLLGRSTTRRRDHDAGDSAATQGPGATATNRSLRLTDADLPGGTAKPDSPTDLTKPSWTSLLRRTVREFSQDQCTDLAAALTYYGVLSIFPALIAVMSLVGVFGQGRKTVRTLTGILENLGVSSPTLEKTITQLSQTPGAGLALVLGLAAALWTASGYVGSFGRAMNRIYGIGEGRPIWKLRPVMLLITALTVLLAALVLVGLVVSGSVAQAIGEAVGVGSTAVQVWGIAKWPVMVLVVVVIVALLYYATPNVQQPTFRWISTGALVAILVWVAASVAFGFYVGNFSSYNKTYGSLAGVIVFLLWLWITNLALLFGAELNVELERGRQLQAGIAAERTVQLPLRDTRSIRKAEAKEEDDVARARRLRRSRGRRADLDD